MNITYISACLDNSGYGEAARNHIAGLFNAGVLVNVVPISFERFRSDLGNLGHLIKGLVKVNEPGQIQILHATPDNYPRMKNSQKYNIGYAAWETDKAPAAWVPLINQLQELWVPSFHNVTCFKDAGVKVPIYCMPHPLDKQSIEAPTSPVFQKNDGEFTFYSIFQWTERKNPLGMLVAYLSEFTSTEKVNFVIKTYLRNPEDPREVNVIKDLIAKTKQEMRLGDFPRLSLITSLMSRAQVQALHRDADVFMLLHRCEGFGLPVAEAMLAGNPVITTGYGGTEDFVINDTHGKVIDYHMTPVVKMPWGHYNAKMNWAEPNIAQAKQAMRYMFENQDKAETMGQHAQQWMEQNYNWKVLGHQMRKRLEEIEKSL